MLTRRLTVISLVAASLQVACSTPRAKVGAGQEVPEGTAARIVWLEQAVSRDPKDVEAWTQLGNDYYDTNRPALAVAAYDRSLELRPNVPDVLCDQASMYRALGHLSSAEANLKRAIEINPRHLNSLVNLGVIYASDLRQPQKGIRLWEQVISLGAGAQAERARALISEFQPKQ